MGVVVPLFKEQTKEQRLETVRHEGLSAVSEQNIYANIQLQIDMLKRQALEFHGNALAPTLVDELSLSYDGLYTVLDLLANCVSGTLFPACAAKHIQVYTVKDEPDNFGLFLRLTENNVFDSALPKKTMTLSITQLDNIVMDFDKYGGFIDEAWDDYTLDPDWDVPNYMGNIVDNLMCMAVVNNGYAALSGPDRFTVNLPFHPSRCIQINAVIA